MRITIFGGGAWGRALAFALSFKNDVKVVSRQDLREYFLSLKTQNPIVQVDFEDSLDSHLFINAIKTQALRQWFSSHPLPKDTPMMLASKGIEEGSCAFVSDIAAEYLRMENLCFLAGPSFAKEILQSLPCALCIHSENKQLASQYASTFPDFIKAYVVNDVIGGEIAGAYKNVVAIASGICDGLGLGNNARASLLARGLVEMHRFADAFGGRIETFLGLSGAGDLFLSASSSLSRNYRVGFGLAKGKNLEEILEEIGEVAEGVISTYAIHKIAQDRGIYAPIAKELHEILENRSDARLSLRRLMC